MITNKQDNDVPSINNKDFLIASLLKYICTIHDVPEYAFHTIYNYLIKNDIIDSVDLNSVDAIGLKNIYANLIKNIVATGNNKELKDIEYSDCRYTKEFIQEGIIGQGGYGCVFDSRYKLDNNRYAVKKIYIKDLKKEGSKYYLNEVRLLSNLNHVNIVRYYTSWVEFEYPTININKSTDILIPTSSVKPVLYIQMELCKKSLYSYIKDRNYEETEINKCDEYLFINQIIQGLKYIHNNGIIHGDLTPQNIFIDSNFNIKIGDFGLAKKTDRSDENTEFGSYGNILYMAKEQLDDNICNVKSDIYSFGIIYIELLSKFKTQKERAESIIKFKNGETIQNTLMDDKDIELVNNMMMNDYNNRFTSTDVENFFSEHIISL